jgi:hypothetical protein
MSQEEQNLEDLQTEGNEHGIKKGQQQQLNGHSDSSRMKAALWLLSYDDDGSQQQHYPVLEGRTYGVELIHSCDARCQTHCLSDYDGYGYGYPNREIVSWRAKELKLT